MTTNQLRGLIALVRDAVHHGSLAIEELEKKSASRPFELLEQIPPLALPARLVHIAHDAGVSGVHIAIRGVNHAVGEALRAVLLAVEADETSR
ncbi:MAG: hypothetical protein HY698_00535 [Deltaproteobacteria bacterium]|nr:hypothetical protein [Deltaproteobacteria bacterium]